MIPMRGVTACQEMERWKREKERASRFIWTLAGGERASALVREGWGGWVVGIPVCSVQGWGADWRTLTSAQQEQLDSITSSTEGSYAAALHGRGLWKGKRGGEREPSKQPTNTTQHRAVPGVIESMFLCLTSHFRDPKGGPKATWGKSLRPSV